MIRSTCSGASLMPGISGAIRIPVGMPARLSSADRLQPRARVRRVRLARRHAFSSSVGTDRHAVTSVTLGDLAHQIEVAQQQRRLRQHRARVRGVAERLPDAAHELVAALDPLVRVGVRAQRDVLALPRRPGSSARSTSGTLTLTTISRSKSRPASKSRYSCVGRAKQLWLTTPFAMKSPVPVVMSYSGMLHAERLDRATRGPRGLERAALDRALAA